MKPKMIIAAAFTISFYACTNAGEGSEKTTDSTSVNKDSGVTVNQNSSTSSKDTASYEQMPNKTADSSKP